MDEGLLRELWMTVSAVERKHGVYFTLSELNRTLWLTLRKVELNGKEAEYIPLLFENELEDLLMRQEINRKGMKKDVYDLRKPEMSAGMPECTYTDFGICL